MRLNPGDTRFDDPVVPFPFLTLQPAFYSACVSNPQSGMNSPCDPSLDAGTSPGPDAIPMEYSFNFDDGFLGTDQNSKQFYVMVYYPAAP